MSGKEKHVLILGTDPKYLVNLRGPLVRTLIEMGHRVSAVASPAEPELLAPLKKLNVDFHVSPLQRAGLNPFRDALAIAKLYRLFRQIRPDVFFGYTIKPVGYGMTIARAAGIPRRTGMMAGLGYAFTGAEGRAVVRFAADRILHAGISQSHMMIFQNPDDRQTLAERGLVRDLSRTAIVNGSGVDLDHYASCPLPEGPTTFLMIARLLKDKGLFEYVEAARSIRTKYPQTRFLLAGGIDPNPAGIKITELNALISDGIVEYRGEVSDVRPIIREAHVYVLPSYREGTPRTVLEAMAMRRAIITSDGPGCKETIEDGISGFLVPIKDARSLAAKMKTFIENRDLIVRMAQAALQRVREKYEAGAVARATAKLILGE